MEIRQLTGDELKQALAVWSQAFEDGDLEMSEWKEWEEKFPEGRVTYGIFDEAGLQATFLIMDWPVHFGAELQIPMAAVCGVACLPAARGKGYAGLGVRYALDKMREAGQVLSLLEPFSWDFYWRLGYEWIHAPRRYFVPTRLLKPCRETESVRAAVASDRDQIIGCYTQFAGRYRGMLVRKPTEWDWMLSDRPKKYTYTYVYEQDGRIEGYLTYNGGKREETRLREFICLTPSAQHGLLGLLRRHDMQIEKFVWDAPPDDSLWSLLMHNELETKLRPKLMGRIVDVPGALQALQPEEQARGTVMLGVEDSSATWNQRTWRVEFEHGRVEVTPTEYPPQISLDIQALAQAYFGALSVDMLVEAGRLTIQDAEGQSTLSRLLDGPPMWCNDGF